MCHVRQFREILQTWLSALWPCRPWGKKATHDLSPAVGQPPSHGMAVRQEAPDLCPHQLSAWQLQSVYTVLKALEHPGALLVQQVRMRPHGVACKTVWGGMGRRLDPPNPWP